MSNDRLFISQSELAEVILSHIRQKHGREYQRIDDINFRTNCNNQVEAVVEPQTIPSFPTWKQYYKVEDVGSISLAKGTNTHSRMWRLTVYEIRARVDKEFNVILNKDGSYASTYTHVLDVAESTEISKLKKLADKEYPNAVFCCS